MDDLGFFVFVVVIILIIGLSVKSCSPKAPPTTPQIQSVPDAVKPPANKKIAPPKEISSNVYQFESSSWPECLASWVEANPKKRIIGKPVFQPSWDGADVGTYLVVTEDAPKAEPKLEK